MITQTMHCISLASGSALIVFKVPDRMPALRKNQRPCNNIRYLSDILMCQGRA